MTVFPPPPPAYCEPALAAQSNCPRPPTTSRRRRGRSQRHHCRPSTPTNWRMVPLSRLAVRGRKKTKSYRLYVFYIVLCSALAGLICVSETYLWLCVNAAVTCHLWTLWSCEPRRVHSSTLILCLTIKTCVILLLYLCVINYYDLWFVCVVVSGWLDGWVIFLHCTGR